MCIRDRYLTKNDVLAACIGGSVYASGGGGFYEMCIRDRVWLEEGPTMTGLMMSKTD